VFKINIVVVIPAFNEEKTIGKVIDKVKNALQGYSFKILVVNDGSTDLTEKIALKHGAIVVSHHQRLGLAQAFRTAMKKCFELNPEVIVHIDADLQYNPKEIPRLLKEIENGFDLVLGSRFLGEIEEMPLIKRLGNKAFSKIVSHITGFPITDAQTGFRAFTLKIAELKIVGNYTYTQEQLIIALKKGFKVKEVPVSFAKRVDKSRLISSPLQYALRAGINVLRVYRDFAPLKFFGIIGLFFTLTGMLIGFYLVFLHLTTGIFGHIPLIVLTAMLILVGIQITLFGFLADMRVR
jgi:glycosyltransferase involved in cell wall biosynthesis